MDKDLGSQDCLKLYLYHCPDILGETKKVGWAEIKISERTDQVPQKNKYQGVHNFEKHDVGTICWHGTE